MKKWRSKADWDIHWPWCSYGEKEESIRLSQNLEKSFWVAANSVLVYQDPELVQRFWTFSVSGSSRKCTELWTNGPDLIDTWWHLVAMCTKLCKIVMRLWFGVKWEHSPNIFGIFLAFRIIYGLYCIIKCPKCFEDSCPSWLMFYLI